MGNVRLVRDKVDQRRKGASKEQSKIRVLAVERMLSFDRMVTVKEIQRRLELQYDMHATPKTIYDDLYAIDRFIPLEVVTGCGGGFKKCDFREAEDGRNK